MVAAKPHASKMSTTHCWDWFISGSFPGLQAKCKQSERSSSEARTQSVREPCSLRPVGQLTFPVFKVTVKLFDCPFCGNIVYFESRACAACGRGLGYLPSRECMASAEDLIAGTHSVCANAAFDVCTGSSKMDRPTASLAGITARCPIWRCRSTKRDG